MKKNMKEIKINDNWTISPDNDGYILREYRINKVVKKDGTKGENYGKLMLYDTKYPVRIKSALRLIMEREARVNLDGLSAFNERMNEVENNLDRLIEVHKLKNKKS